MLRLKKGRNEILHDIYGELSKQVEFTIKDNIHIISFRESKDHMFMALYNFLCENYYSYNNFRWCYSPNLFKYFLKDSVVVIFYKMDASLCKKIICGMVIGKPIDVMHSGNYDFPIISKSIDVNFLCVKKELRGSGICRFLKNVLIKTTIEHDSSVNSALFTIGTDKRYNMYSQKKYYSKMLNNGSDQENLKIQLTKEKLNINVFLSTQLSESILMDIKNYIYNDNINIKRYDIFQLFDKDNLRDIMENQEFIKIFITRGTEIVGLVILYHLDFEENGKLLKNVFVYNYFTRAGLSDELMWFCVEEVCKSMGINVIMSTLWVNNSFLDTGVNLKYYDYNLELNNISRNGLVTI